MSSVHKVFVLRSFICLIWAWLNLANTQAWAQGSRGVLEIEYDTLESPIRLPNHWEWNHPNEADSLLSAIKDSLNQMGYLEAGVDQIEYQNNRIIAQFHIGSRAEHIQLHIGSDPKNILGSLGIAPSKLEKWPFEKQSIKGLLQMLLRYYENHGYPFAKASIEHYRYINENWEADLTLEKGPEIRFDTLEVVGNARASASFLAALLEIKPGSLYSERLVRQIDRKLMSLSFVKLSAPTSIIFIGNQAKPMLYLEHRNSDIIDGIIGMAPSADGGLTPNEQLLLTGEVRMRFGNLFKGGQSLDLNWRSFNERSQELKLALGLPYLLGTNLSLQPSFNAVKFDTLFAQFNGGIGLGYLLNGSDQISFFYERQATNLLSVDTLAIRNSRQPPLNQSMLIQNYGIEGRYRRLDYLFNPRKGIYISGRGLLGTKSIRRESRINALVLESPATGDRYNLYDSLRMRMNQYRIAGQIDTYLPLGKSSTLKSGIMGERIMSPEIYFNELMRYGGIYTLRGFNEQSLFASTFVMFTLEYRYLLAQNSNFFVFMNGAYYQDASIVRATPYQDTPIGMGIGANLETGAGILTLAYAIGREANNPIQFQAGKVHFGLTGLF